MFPFPAPVIIKPSGSAAFEWNPADKSEVTLSNNNKTAKPPTTAEGFRGSVRTISEIGTSIAKVIHQGNEGNLAFGLSLKTVSLEGATFTRAGTYFLFDNGSIYKNGSLIPNGPQTPTFAFGDRIGVSFDGANVTFYKNDIAVYSTSRVSGETGLLFPTYCGFGSQVTITP